MSPQELRSAWAKDPMVMVKMCWPDVKLYDKQIEILYSVRDNPETFVPAGNMLGKDFIASIIALWFFLSNDFARIVVTSVKDDHLRVFWGEFMTRVERSVIPLTAEKGGPLNIMHHDVRKVVGSPESRAKSYLRCMVSRLGEGMAGHHAPNTLLLIDEASGVPDTVIDQGQTWARRILAIGNCNPTTNFFYKGVKAGDLLA